MNSRVAWLVVGVVLLFAGEAIGQSDSLWWRTYGGVAGDWANAVVETETGDFVMAGATGSFSESATDFWLLCTAPNGDSLWSHSFDAGAMDEATCLIQTSDGGYALAGIAYEGPWISDYAIVRTNSIGELLWVRRYGGSGDDQCTGIVQTADGGFAIGGYANIRNGTASDFWLLRLDADGDSLWSSVYGGQRGDYCDAMVQMDDGGFALAGYTYSFREGGSRTSWLVRADANGDSLWAKTYGGERENEFGSIAKAIDGSLMLAGCSTSYGHNDGDYWIIKVDAAGDTIWSNFYGTPDFDRCTSIKHNSDGGYSLTGYGNGNGYQPWLVKIDSDGDSLWSRGFVGPMWYCRDHIETRSGRFVLVGEAFNTVDLSDDLLFVETGIDPLDVSSISTPICHTLFSTFPSPFNSSLSISYSSPTNAPLMLSLVDLSGRTLQQNWLPGTSSGSGIATIGTTALPSGNYFVIVGGNRDGAVMPVRCLK